MITSQTKSLSHRITCLANLCEPNAFFGVVLDIFSPAVFGLVDEQLQIFLMGQPLQPPTSNAFAGSECEDLRAFDARCNDETKWAKKLRRQARNRVGLPCRSGTNASYNSGSIAKFVKWLESDWFDNEYCELSNGTQIECYSITEPFAILFRTSKSSPKSSLL